MENVALIGMSRGGEAVALAATFNQWQTLPHSDEALDLGFNIRAVIALAPMDGQYLHTDGSNILKNTNYLVLQAATMQMFINFSVANNGKEQALMTVETTLSN